MKDDPEGGKWGMATEHTMRIGIVGTGWFAAKHAGILSSMDHVTVSGVCGSSLAKSKAFQRDFASARAYASVHEMLDGCKLDAVYICVPPFAHGEIELALIARGIPFLVEKPLAVDLETPTTILNAVRKDGIITSVGYHFRYLEGTVLASELLRERTIGMSLGYWMGSMPGVYWWRQAELSGGQAIEQTTHIVDLLRHVVGEVTEVYAAFADTVMHMKGPGVSVPDVGTITLKMENGSIANISNTCILPAGHHSGLYIYTDAGVLELSRNGLKDVLDGRTTEYLNRIDPYEAETRAFLHAVRTGDTSGILSTYEDAWRTQQVTVAAVQSAKTGLPVKLG
jgi:myo-inositol 2-dehydrogenase / D-chiro-inositol 1-dehydrogenase